MEQLLESAKILQRDFGKAVRANRTAEVPGVGGGRVAFRLEDGRRLEPGRRDPQLRHLDRAWASTVHAFQGERSTT